MTLTADFGPAAQPRNFNGPDIPHKPVKEPARIAKRPSSSGSLGMDFSRFETESQKLKKLYENSAVGILNRMLKDSEIFQIQRLNDEMFPSSQALKELERQDRILREFDRAGRVQRILQPCPSL